MISLYHYTCRNNIDLLVTTKVLKRGAIKGPAGELLENTAVSLTDDTDPRGHGLPDGRIVTAAQAEKLKGYWTDLQGNLRCPDHTKYRMRFEFDTNDILLMSAADYYKSDLTVLHRLEETAYYPIEKIVPPVETMRILAELAAGTIRRKGATWWYYFEDINLSSWIDLAVRLDSGEWLPVEKQKFLDTLAQLNSERAEILSLDHSA